MLIGPAIAQDNGAQSTAPGSNNGRSLQVSNFGRDPIVTLYASPSSAREWSPNLVSAPFQPNTNVQVTLSSSDCAYDVLAIYASGAKTQLNRVNTCDVSNVAFAGPNTGEAAQTPYRIIFGNSSAEQMTALYARPTGTQDWGQNRITVPLALNAQLPADLPGCQYDFDVQYATGDVIYTNVNVCAYVSLAFAAPPSATANGAAPQSDQPAEQVAQSQDLRPPVAAGPISQSGTVSFKRLLAAGYEIRTVEIVPLPEMTALAFPPGSAPYVLVTLQNGSSSAACNFNWISWRNQVPAELERSDLCSAYVPAP